MLDGSTNPATVKPPAYNDVSCQSGQRSTNISTVRKPSIAFPAATFTEADILSHIMESSLVEFSNSLDNLCALRIRVFRTVRMSCVASVAANCRSREDLEELGKGVPAFLPFPDVGLVCTCRPLAVYLVLAYPCHL